jgi:hypothetical protein
MRRFYRRSRPRRRSLDEVSRHTGGRPLAPSRGLVRRIARIDLWRPAEHSRQRAVGKLGDEVLGIGRPVARTFVRGMDCRSNGLAGGDFKEANGEFYLVSPLGDIPRQNLVKSVARRVVQRGGPGLLPGRGHDDPIAFLGSRSASSRRWRSARRETIPCGRRSITGMGPNRREKSPPLAEGARLLRFS